MRLILVRHGETNENKNKVVQGFLNTTLSKIGIQQAKKVANRLKDEKIDFAYSSDLDRAKQTAKEQQPILTRTAELTKTGRMANAN